MVAASAPPPPPPALSDLWYAAELPGACLPLDALLAGRPLLRRLCATSRLARALALFALGHSFPVVMTKFHPVTGLALPLLEALAGRRRLVFLEFITPLERGGRFGPALTALYGLYLRALVAPLLRRSMRSAQVMTAWEGDRYSAAYGIPRDRFRLIPWSLNQGEWEPRDIDGDEPAAMVLSSGRAACDWDTLFAAARGADWPLTVICGADERAEVDRLNAHHVGGRATVLSEVSLAEHAGFVRRATVYVLCLHDIAASSGQIRLGNCNEIGTPVVASRVKGLAPYLVEGVNADTVPAGDAGALRRAVDRLLASPDARRGLARRARAHSLSFTRADQLAMIAALATEPG